MGGTGKGTCVRTTQNKKNCIQVGPKPAEKARQQYKRNEKKGRVGKTQDYEAKRKKERESPSFESLPGGKRDKRGERPKKRLEESRLKNEKGEERHINALFQRDGSTACLCYKEKWRKQGKRRGYCINLHSITRGV